jgi:hypothetical protein
VVFLILDCCRLQSLLKTTNDFVFQSRFVPPCYCHLRFEYVFSLFTHNDSSRHCDAIVSRRLICTWRTRSTVPQLSTVRITVTMSTQPLLKSSRVGSPPSTTGSSPARRPSSSPPGSQSDRLSTSTREQTPPPPLCDDFLHCRAAAGPSKNTVCHPTRTYLCHGIGDITPPSKVGDIIHPTRHQVSVCRYCIRHETTSCMRDRFPSKLEPSQLTQIANSCRAFASNSVADASAKRSSSTGFVKARHSSSPLLAIF